MDRGDGFAVDAFAVAELDLVKGIRAAIDFLAEARCAACGWIASHGVTAEHDDSRLFVALTNRDEIDALDTKTGKGCLHAFYEIAGAKNMAAVIPKSLGLPRRGTLFRRMRFPIRWRVRSEPPERRQEGRGSGIIPTEFTLLSVLHGKRFADWQARRAAVRG